MCETEVLGLFVGGFVLSSYAGVVFHVGKIGHRFVIHLSFCRISDFALSKFYSVVFCVIIVHRVLNN